MESEFLIYVFYKQNSTKIFISPYENLVKLFKIVEIYFDELKEKNYSLLFKESNINLKALSIQTKLLDVISKNKIVNAEIKDEKIELFVEVIDNENNNITFECELNHHIKVFKLSNQFIFQKLKFNILALFTDLEVENYSISFMNNDITNIFSDTKIISEIFPNKENVKLILKIKSKNIVEYYKRCSFCTDKKAFYVCNKCAISHCEECSIKDDHEIINFIKVEIFKDYEQNILQNFLDSLKILENKNLLADSNKNDENMKNRVLTIEKYFDSLIYLINEMKIIELNDTKKNQDYIKNKFKPDKFETIMKSLFNLIFKYKSNTFYDAEESMKKILEFEKMFITLTNDFDNYNQNVTKIDDQFYNYKKINEKLLNSINQNLLELNLVNKDKPKIDKFHPIMKVYDDKSILVYENNSEKFNLMNFVDIQSKFKQNFNNYVQLNYLELNLLFIITGNPCQQLFCYNLNTNEMEYINNLKFNHNWWPVILITENTENNKSLNIFCISGSYTKKCEKLEIKLEEKKKSDSDVDFNNSNNIKNKKEINLDWIEIPSTNVSHGQASGFIINNSILYVMFGYDCYLNSIATVERLDMNNSQSWEIIQFINPDSISSILYYHSNMKLDDDNIFIIGGLKQINQVDVVYKFDVINSTLFKTDHKFELGNVKFCNEKNFILLNKIINNYYDDENNLNNKNHLKESFTFAIFDGNNNLHKINSNTFEHSVKEILI